MPNKYINISYSFNLKYKDFGFLFYYKLINYILYKNNN